MRAFMKKKNPQKPAPEENYDESLSKNFAAIVYEIIEAQIRIFQLARKADTAWSWKLCELEASQRGYWQKFHDLHNNIVTFLLERCDDRHFKTFVKGIATDLYSIRKQSSLEILDRNYEGIYPYARVNGFMKTLELYGYLTDLAQGFQDKENIEEINSLLKAPSNIIFRPVTDYPSERKETTPTRPVR
jgi:hypothetical protein